MSHICNDVPGIILECKTCLKTLVPPSISNRASLVPFVFSSEAARGEDIFMTLAHAPEQIIDKTCSKHLSVKTYFCERNLHSLQLFVNLFDISANQNCDSYCSLFDISDLTSLNQMISCKSDLYLGLHG